MAAKVLITGVANSGKTTLLKPLQNAFVVSRDGKPFSLPLPHMNVPDFSSADELMGMLEEKIGLYITKTGKSPDTVVFDSVSRILTDLDVACSKKYKGFDVWSNLNKEINTLLAGVNDLLTSGFNVVLIAHAIYDTDSGRYIETCKGQFAKLGGFLGTVDYAINIDLVGKQRVLTHRNGFLSRTFLDNVPDKENADAFNLQDYLNQINIQTSSVQEFSY